MAFAAVAVVAFSAYQLVIEQDVGRLGDSAENVYRVVVGGLLVMSVIRAIGGVRYASLRDFEQPYLSFRQAERQRHQEALRQWERSFHRHQGAVADAAHASARQAAGPKWFPVRPASDPTRVDVFGGDPHRRGWASLLVALGSALPHRGRRITVLDFTGQEVGDNLVAIADAAGLTTKTVRFGEAASTHGRVDLLGGLPQRDLTECLGHALTGRPDGDRREEHALVTDTLNTVMACLDPRRPSRGWPRAYVCCRAGSATSGCPRTRSDGWPRGSGTSTRTSGRPGSSASPPTPAAVATTSSGGPARLDAAGCPTRGGTPGPAPATGPPPRTSATRRRPAGILGMPETAFILVDNTGQGRRVVGFIHEYSQVA